MNKAVVLLSGGLDSTTVLYYSKSKGYVPSCLIFDYGQRHNKEILQAKIIANKIKSKYYVVKISLPWKGSALLDKKIKIPDEGQFGEKHIPSTYVPSRNIIFLSFAASFAETIGSRSIFIGVNAVDYSGYPDCRSEFINAYKNALAEGLKTGIRGKTIDVKTPLINKTKTEIIRLGMQLKVPYQYTWSCYKGGKYPCGRCDSCRIRAKGFESAGYRDPLLIKNKRIS